jgi:ribosomal protein L15E
MEAGTLQINLSRTGKAQKVASNGQGVKVISSGRQQRVAKIEQPAGAAPTVQREAVSIGPAAEAALVIWTARLRTGRVVTFRANGSRAFKAAGSIAPVAAEDLAGVIALAAAGIDSVGVASVAEAALADSAAAAGSGADVNN